MAGRIIPPELMIQIGICLRQARTARLLSVEQAAEQLEIPVGCLEKIELGQEQITDIEAQMMIVRYRGARADRLDSLLYEWAMDELSRQSKTDQRKHLSLVSDESKPWENPKKEWK